MLSAIIGRELTDIYTIGFIYLEDGPGEFIPDLRWMYFEFGDILMEFASVEQFSRLKVEKVSGIRYPFERDGDMVMTRSSVKELVLVSSMLAGNIVKAAELLDDEGKDCAAAKILLENGQVIFIDPGFPYGIGVGGEEQEKYWRYANNKIP